MNDDNNAKRRPTVSQEALAFEIDSAQAHFEVSSHWLSSLAENIERFPDMEMEATEVLRKLEARALKGKVKKSE